MGKFDRIVQETSVMGGQARIRDTGIIVNEIVRLSLDGKSQAEILGQFATLEAEDVHQAISWNSLQLANATINMSFEIRTPMTPIKGYSQLISHIKHYGEV